MRVRLMSALVMVPVVLVAMIAGNPWWALAAAAVAALAVREQLSLAGAAGIRSAAPLAYGLALVLVLAALKPDMGLSMPAIAVAVFAAYGWQMLSAPEDRSLAGWTATVAFPTATGILCAYVVLLRGLPDGLSWTFLLLAMVWVNDSAAYLGGRALGHRPFFATISPKKTLEGAAIGAAATVAVCALAPYLAAALPGSPGALASVSPWSLAVLGLVVSVLAPAGDLSQSYIKRQAGAKDSSHLIPGHGGVLDRVDSFAFVAPVVYYVALLLGNGAA
jgi:phosphatidate cytidylyltransferase